MFILGNKLNRLYSLHLPFETEYCDISVVFNKSNCFIGFNLDQKTYLRSRNDEIKSTIFTDLTNSSFASCFLDLRDFKSKTLDIKRQFNNILPQFKDKIHYETNETIKLSKVQTPQGKFESCLFIYVFRLTDYGNNFLFTLVERQHIDVVLDRKIVRTSGIQLCSSDTFEDLNRMISAYRKEDVPDNNKTSVEHLFDERRNVMNFGRHDDE